VNDLLKGLNVFLIGMMGAGKTTVGGLLASELGYGFCDTDVLIEQIAGKTINEIFADDGEETFRNLETQVLSELSAYQQLIVATGGGIVLKPQNWSYLHYGLVVWLDVPVPMLIERLREDTTRPLLQKPDPALELQQILDQRRSLYELADLHICEDFGKTPPQIASRVITEIPKVLKNSKQKNN